MSTLSDATSSAYQLGAHDYNEGKANDVLRTQHLRDRVALTLHALTLPESITETQIGSAYEDGYYKAMSIATADSDRRNLAFAIAQGLPRREAAMLVESHHEVLRIEGVPFAEYVASYLAN